MRGVYSTALKFAESSGRSGTVAISGRSGWSLAEDLPSNYRPFGPTALVDLVQFLSAEGAASYRFVDLIPSSPGRSGTLQLCAPLPGLASFGDGIFYKRAAP